MKIAIVGCGGIAQVHAGCIDEIVPGSLCAAADIVRERAEDMTARYGGRAYDDWEVMLDNEEIDVLHICTPHYLHTPMAVRALERGIHVFMEKPPAVSWEQWEQLKKAEKESDAFLGICFQNRFNSNVRYVKKELERNAYGKILGARGIVTWHRDVPYYRDSPWRGRTATEGGGALINQGIHTLDLIQYLIGEKPVSIQAVADNQHLQGVIQVEDTLAATIVYPDTAANLYVTTGCFADLPYLLDIFCESCRIRLEGQQLTIWDQEGIKKEVSFTEEKQLGKDYWGAGHLGCIRSFYHSVEQKLPSMGTEAAEDTVWLLLKAYESAGRHVPPCCED